MDVNGLEPGGVYLVKQIKRDRYGFQKLFEIQQEFDYAKISDVGHLIRVPCTLYCYLLQLVLQLK